jgi:proteasome accessory factor C
MGPPELVDEARARLDAIIERHRGEPAESVASGTPPAPSPVEAESEGGRGRGGETSIRPERFARLVTLASVLIAAGREGRRLPMREVCEQLQISEQELREDISVLNVVNFGGGAYVIYAEVHPNGEIEVDPEPYSDTFDRPARLLPIEANALVAAIDLIGTHLDALQSARAKIVAALGHDPVEEGLHVNTPVTSDDITRTVERAVHAARRLEIEYWAPNEDAFSHRVVEPYALFNSREAWYVAAVDPAKDSLRHFRLDRIKNATMLAESFERRADLDPVADVGGWPRTGEVEGSRRAHVWISPDQARWMREQRTVLAELPDGAVIVEWAYKGTAYLVREVLKEAGDAVVLEPAEARGAVLAAAEGLLAPSAS